MNIFDCPAPPEPAPWDPQPNSWTWDASNEPPRRTTTTRQPRQAVAKAPRVTRVAAVKQPRKAQAASRTSAAVKVATKLNVNPFGNTNVNSFAHGVTTTFGALPNANATPFSFNPGQNVKTNIFTVGAAGELLFKNAANTLKKNANRRAPLRATQRYGEELVGGQAAPSDASKPRRSSLPSLALVLECVEAQQRPHMSALCTIERDVAARVCSRTG